MPLPLLAIPAIAAALGLGVQAARGKTSNKDLWKGALIGGGAGLGGMGLAGASPGFAGLLGKAGIGAGAKAATGGGLGAMMTNAGVNAMAGAAPQMAMSAMQPDQTMTAPGQMPQMSQPVDPFAILAMIQQMKRGGLS